MSDLKPLGPPAPSPATADDEPRPPQGHRGWRSRGYLPHCDEANLIQHLVFGLHDALPRNAVLPSAMHADRSLDRGHGCCILGNPACAGIVQDALLNKDTEDYRLLAWCVMPNHVHVLIEQIEGASLDTLIQAWKSSSAHRINNLLGRKGKLWRREYFDRFMRDADHFSTTITYIEKNPVEAKLTSRPADWPWSSASHRWKDAGEGAGGPR